jgi:hypothetical protein
VRTRHRHLGIAYLNTSLCNVDLYSLQLRLTRSLHLPFSSCDLNTKRFQKLRGKLLSLESVIEGDSAGPIDQNPSADSGLPMTRWKNESTREGGVFMGSISSEAVGGKGGEGASA